MLVLWVQYRKSVRRSLLFPILPYHLQLSDYQYFNDLSVNPQWTVMAFNVNWFIFIVENQVSLLFEIVKFWIERNKPSNISDGLVLYPGGHFNRMGYRPRKFYGDDYRMYVEDTRWPTAWSRITLEWQDIICQDEFILMEGLSIR